MSAPGLTGRIVSSVDESVQAIPGLLALDRKAIRGRFEQRFSSARMAADYAKIYHAMLRRRIAPEIRRAALAGRLGSAEVNIICGRP